jgi:ComF family protein
MADSPLRSIAREFLDLLAPPRCAGCGELCREAFCERCLPQIETLDGPQCPRCGHPHPPTAPGWPMCGDCREHPRPALRGARSVALHVGPLRQAILDFKFDNHRALAEPLGAMLGRRFSNELARPHRLPFDDLTAIVPVVLHPARHSWRGFDQAKLLSRELSKHCDKPVWEDVLERIRNTRPQIELTQNQRAENMRGAFEARKSFKLQGASLLLVDDVYTTGATLKEAAKALRSGGAQSVYALTLTRATPAWHPGSGHGVSPGT